MRTILIAAALAACAADQAPLAVDDRDLLGCGPSPDGEEPGFSLTEVPPQAACMPAPQYEAYQAWVGRLRDWAVCVSIAACRERGGCQ